MDDIQRDANRRITGQGKHTTTPTGTPQKDKEPRLFGPPPPQRPLPLTPVFPFNPVQLPPPDTSASSSSSAPAPKAKAKAKAMATSGSRSTSRKGTNKEGDKPEYPPRKTTAGRSSSPQPTQAAPATRRSRSRAQSETAAEQLAPSVIGIQKLREEMEQAKNKNKLSVADTSKYMKLYDEWKEAKGNADLKRTTLKELQALYKRTVYKK